MLLVVLSACSSGDECAAGEERMCVGEEDCEGEQRCAGQPLRWLPCECADPALPQPSRVGQECLTDEGCEADEHCFDAERATFLGGAPPRSFCTLRCDAKPEICAQRKPAAVCTVTEEGSSDDHEDDEAHCLERCTLGEVSDEKCGGGEHFACATLRSLNGAGEPGMASVDAGSDAVATSTMAAACRPLCSADIDCAPERCDRRAGVCSPEPRSGDGFGTACEPNTSSTSCEGLCVAVDGVGFCSQRCQFGSAENCGDAPNGAESGGEGLCRFPEETVGSFGDVGFCAVLCERDADCGHEGLHCEAFDEEVAAIVQSSGVCVPTSLE